MMKPESVRNGLVAGANGAVTLVILLIAPLGLATVLVNTVLVVLCSYVVGQTADRVVKGLGPPKSLRAEVLPQGHSSGTDLEKRE